MQPPERACCCRRQAARVRARRRCARPPTRCWCRARWRRATTFSSPAPPRAPRCTACSCSQRRRQGEPLFLKILRGTDVCLTGRARNIVPYGTASCAKGGLQIASAGGCLFPGPASFLVKLAAWLRRAAADPAGCTARHMHGMAGSCVPGAWGASVPGTDHTLEKQTKCLRALRGAFLPPVWVQEGLIDCGVAGSMPRFCPLPWQCARWWRGWRPLQPWTLAVGGSHMQSTRCCTRCTSRSSA